MNPVELENIWHLWNVNCAEDEWEFSTNYKVPLEDGALRSLLQGETRFPMAGDPEMLKCVRVLVTETRGRTADSEPIAEGEYSVKTQNVLVRLMRKPTSEGRRRKLICVGDARGPGDRKLRDIQKEFEIDELSAGSQAAVHRLDGLSLEICHRMYGEKAQALDEYPPESIPPTRKVAAFIAYRRTHQNEAKRLHAILAGAGAGTLFEPYLDLHDMKLGDWRAQILSRIESADVFVCLVSPDYAAPDTFGLVEYEKAKETAEQKQWDDFFAPIFVGHPETEPGLELRDYDGFIARDSAEIHEENRALEDWIGRVASAGMNR